MIEFTDVERQSDKYLSLLFDSEVPEPGEAPPEQVLTSDELRGNNVEAFIDGVAYFTAIDNEITSLLKSPGTKPYFYMTAWWLGLIACNAELTLRTFGDAATTLLKAFPDVPIEWKQRIDMEHLVLPVSGQPMLTRLCDLADAGVDVRVLAWTSPFAPKYQPVAAKVGSIVDLNLQTILSVDMLRGVKALEKRVLLNTLAHPFGAAHAKMAVCGNDDRMCAYTGGIDPVASRLLPPPDVADQDRGGWHDVCARVEGPAAAGMYRFFAQLWKEQLAQSVETFHVAGKDIDSHSKSAPVVPDRPPVRVRRGDQRVQVLRTVPRMRFSTAGPEALSPNPVYRWAMSTASGFKRPALSFAKDGIFEFKVALKKAIANAESYVFIADQALSAMEVMDWLNARLKQKPALKVILLHGADPMDPPSGFLHEAINNHLLPGVTFGQVSLHSWQGTVVHCKVTIVDDAWCAIGSANSMRRSLYTDIELSVGILDAGSGFVKRFRRDLWTKYCGLPIDSENARPDLWEQTREELLDLNKALGIWESTWGAAPKEAKLLKAIGSLPKPLLAPVHPFDARDYDQEDADSRNKF